MILVKKVSSTKANWLKVCFVVGWLAFMFLAICYVYFSNVSSRELYLISFPGEKVAEVSLAGYVIADIIAAIVSYILGYKLGIGPLFLSGVSE
jgi:hypothetical protein